MLTSLAVDEDDAMDVSITSTFITNFPHTESPALCVVTVVHNTVAALN